MLVVVDAPRDEVDLPRVHEGNHDRAVDELALEPHPRPSSGARVVRLDGEDPLHSPLEGAVAEVRFQRKRPARKLEGAG
jgi:hypothetical protein